MPECIYIYIAKSVRVGSVFETQLYKPASMETLPPGLISAFS